jgi:hypothetical protein
VEPSLRRVLETIAAGRSQRCDAELATLQSMSRALEAIAARDSDRPDDSADKALDALLERAKDHGEFDRSRIAAMQQRAAWMLALAGVIIGLGATQARETFIRAPSLGAEGEDIAAVTLGAGLFLIVIAAVCALIAVLPKKTWLLDEPGREKLYKQKESAMSEREIKSQYLDFLFTRLARDLESYRRLRRTLLAAFISMVVGLALIAAHIGVYVERTWACELPTEVSVTTVAASPLLPAPGAAIPFFGRKKDPPVYGTGGCGGSGTAALPSDPPDRSSTVS